MWFILLCLLLFQQPSGNSTGRTQSGSGPTVANNCANTKFATNPSASCSLTTTSGDFLVLYYRSDSSITQSQPTGCTAGSWTQSGSTSANQSYWYTTSNTTGTCSVTGSGTSGASGELDFVAVDTSGGSAVDAVPVFQANPSPGFCTSCTGPSITTSNANALVINCTEGDNSITLNAPFTFFLNSNVGGTQLSCSSTNNSSPGSITPTWTAGGSHNPPSGIISVH